jgi:hypothetical protein
MNTAERSVRDRWHRFDARGVGAMCPLVNGVGTGSRSVLGFRDVQGHRSTLERPRELA